MGKILLWNNGNFPGIFCRKSVREAQTGQFIGRNTEKPLIFYAMECIINDEMVSFPIELDSPGMGN